MRYAFFPDGYPGIIMMYAGDRRDRRALWPAQNFWKVKQSAIALLLA